MLHINSPYIKREAKGYKWFQALLESKKFHAKPWEWRRRPINLIV